MGTKRERIFDFAAQRPVDFNEKNIQKVIDRHGFVDADVKYDGIRGVVYFDFKENCWRIVTRENIEILSIRGRVIAGFEAPISDIYDCEVVIPGIDFDTASGLLRAHADLPVGYSLHLYVFDSVLQAGRVRGEFRLPRSTSLDLRVIRATRTRCFNYAAVQLAYESARAGGFEGLVVKDPTQEYTPGKVQGWWKMKPAETLDGIITGFIEGTVGKANEGLYVGFKVKLEDGSECSADGLTKDLMAAITAHPDEYLGRYVEVQRMEASSTGASRHPKFRRFRDSTDNKGVKI